MNETLNLLFSRRSIRRYTSEPIGDDMVRDLLEAAMAAPSACCRDPWAFVVARTPQMLADIAAGLPNGGLLADAAAGIVVCGDMRRAHDEQESFMLQDCSAAIENMLLAANVLGLGACWLGVHPRAERIAHLRNLLKLPGHIVPVSVIALGHPGEEKPARTRFDDTLVHEERWQ